MIENQAELRDAQEKVKELQGEMNRLQSGRVEPDERREDRQMDTLHQQVHASKGKTGIYCIDKTFSVLHSGFERFSLLVLL